MAMYAKNKKLNKSLTVKCVSKEAILAHLGESEMEIETSSQDHFHYLY